MAAHGVYVAKEEPSSSISAKVRECGVDLMVGVFGHVDHLKRFQGKASDEV
ncbi:MAG: hypothetical protein IPM25_07350 [Chloracidobacterium sp.]|nr:hypothetical protein [Chloracidobacterium sp.]